MNLLNKVYIEIGIKHGIKGIPYIIERIYNHETNTILYCVSIDDKGLYTLFSRYSHGCDYATNCVYGQDKTPNGRHILAGILVSSLTNTILDYPSLNLEHSIWDTPSGKSLISHLKQKLNDIQQLHIAA